MGRPHTRPDPQDPPQQSRGQGSAPSGVVGEGLPLGLPADTSKDDRKQQDATPVCLPSCPGPPNILPCT